MSLNVDNSYALNHGLAGPPVDADFPAAALPEQQTILPTGMSFHGEVDKLLAPYGVASRVAAWVVPQIRSQEVLTSAGFTDGLESVQRRLAEGAQEWSSEAAAVVRRLGRELREQVSMRAQARENQSLLLAG